MKTTAEKMAAEAAATLVVVAPNGNGFVIQAQVGPHFTSWGIRGAASIDVGLDAARKSFATLVAPLLQSAYDKGLRDERDRCSALAQERKRALDARQEDGAKRLAELAAEKERVGRSLWLDRLEAEEAHALVLRIDRGDVP